jgi:metallo-beta-lactamase class B
MLRTLAALALMLVASPSFGQFAEARNQWNQPVSPFRVVANIYYVGTAGVSAFLITDPKGHILLDGGLPESARLIAGNIQKLGFKLEDVEYLLNSHAHFDHSGGLAELKRLTGARMIACAGDRPALDSGRVDYRDTPPFSAVKVDRVVEDGGEVRIGEAAMTALLTPGHTKGCTSWRTRVFHSGKPMDVVFSCSLTVAGQDLVGDHGYPEAVDDFRSSFAKLRALKADIFLANHGSFFDLEGKRAALEAGDPGAFVRAADLPAYVDRSEAAFNEELARQEAGGSP